MTPDELDRLEGYARAATPGKWFTWSGSDPGKRGGVDGDVSTDLDGGYVVVTGNFDTEADRDFIAAANPQAVLALIADLRELRAELKAINDRIGDAYLREPETTHKATGDDLIDRLLGIYTVPVNDGAGPLNGSMTFTRRFPTLPLNVEAASRIRELENERSAVVDSLHRHGWPWSPDNMPLPEFVGGLCEAIQSYAVAQEKLRVREHNLEQALKPFAAYLDWRGSAMPDDTLIDHVTPDGPNLGDCRRAAAVLNKETPT